jgi:hypothetical protein
MFRNYFAGILFFGAIIVGFTPNGLGQPTNENHQGVSRIKFLNYEDCVELRNDTTRVVLGHHIGGRVLAYELHGNNILYLSPQESTWDPDDPPTQLPSSAGRFDVGPEIKQVRGNAIWQGRWTASATGHRRASMVSPIDETSGLQVTRDFTLDASSSRLTITQTVHNHGDKIVHQGFWSRTFVKHGGVVVVPCDSLQSRLPDMYYESQSRYIIDLKPEDPAVRRVGEFLVVDGPTKFPKLGFDAAKGWVAYQTRDDLLFVKRYPVFPSRRYAEPTGINLSIWYPNKELNPVCEIEPIGPLVALRPREASSFTVDWWLLDRKFPESAVVDSKLVENWVSENCLLDKSE